ncbi:MAG TPA: pyruvate kinase [Vicinamibacterales bacterium]|nr:pyruvate kinase [Vicinamibacterales bacterium]
MRHTKIVATIGPACDTDAGLDALLRAGVDVFRLNFSHGTQESHRASCERVRNAAARADRTVAILQDLSGPKIRTGPLEGGRPIPLEPGGELRIAVGDFAGAPGRVSTTYADLARVVRPGQELLLDDGRVVLRVVETDGSEIRTVVVHGSSLGEHKGINAPGAELPAAGLTEKDIADLRFGLELGVDMVALSFVRTGAELVEARSVIQAADTSRADLPLIAKLERPEALDHLDAILDRADGVMVARGDLGLEMPLEQVPRAQKEITRRARARGLPVIVATQVLESMRSEPRPTRAEVSDAANAVDDGVDAIMLAGETAAGAFPARAVETLAAVICDAERLPPLRVAVTGASPMHAGHGHALCEAAITLADRGQADAIVAITRKGNTARALSALRPRSPIVAATNSEETARRLCLYRGVCPLTVTLGANVDATGHLIGQALRDRGLVPPGGVIVLVSISEDLSAPQVNFVKLHRLA